MASKKGNQFLLIPRNQESVSWFQGIHLLGWGLGPIGHGEKVSQGQEIKKRFLDYQEERRVLSNWGFLDWFLNCSRKGSRNQEGFFWCMNLVPSSCLSWYSIRSYQEKSRKMMKSRKDFLIQDSWLKVLCSRRNKERFFVCSWSSRKVLEEILGRFHGKAFLWIQEIKKEFLDCLNPILNLGFQGVQ